MKIGKCPNCGANINIDETRDAGICEFCNTPYISEKAMNHINNTSNNAQTIINNYYTVPNSTVTERKISVQEKTPRPKIKVWLAILLCYFYIFPGIIYIFSVRKKQKEWDLENRVINE